jgi:molybdopterin-guanine dinucleotide biosynthesis protein
VAPNGRSVLPQGAALSLNAPLILDCVLVEGFTQDETGRIMGCTEGKTDRSLRDGWEV